MMKLSDLPLKTSYHKGRDNIAEDFYLPCMNLAKTYDRAVGFFRSTVFVVAWRSLVEFVHRGGSMRILCSHVLSEQDQGAISEGYTARGSASLAGRYRHEVIALLGDPILSKPARILAALVALGVIEFKIAILPPAPGTLAGKRIFHDKLGIFTDEDGNKVMFKGSMNETWTGLSEDGNLESVDVAATWLGDRDRERTMVEVGYFEDLWADQYPSIDVVPFPEAAAAQLISAAATDWQDALEELLAEDALRQSSDSRGRVLGSHQAAGLASWEANDRKGILAFATGSGKTFTAIHAIRDALKTHNEIPIVVVPDRLLFRQWDAELRQVLSSENVSILRAGAGHSSWRHHLNNWTSTSPGKRIVLATISTAAQQDFRNRISGGPHLMLVADEVHRLGSVVHRTILDETRFGARLGLSATPERAGDPEGTYVLMRFFDRILEPRYTLADAVRDRVLCKYFYRSHVIRLNSDEQETWNSITRRISRLAARLRGSDQTQAVRDQMMRLGLTRARILKRAQGKIELAESVLSAEHSDGQRWIVYCDNVEQVQAVSRQLARAGLRNMPYHSQIEGDRHETLRWFERNGGILVAIKCLDEGVDIPAVTHALILASSKNPREYVQRRGRVLRRHPGKALAYVHDAIVLPNEMILDAHDEDVGAKIVLGELSRAIEFAGSADNAGAESDLMSIAIDSGIDWHVLLGEGTENEEI
jgi:superfamily II DNA or RNA helicase